MNASSGVGMIDGCKTDFRCVTLSSAAPESLGVAVATVRSGGWGLIDCREGASPPELVNHRFDELIRRTAGAIGLPGLALNLVDAVNESLLAQLATVEHVLLVQLPADAELDACKHLVNCPQRVLLLQAPITWNLQHCSGDSLVSADQIDGWVVVGSELTRSDSDSSVFVVAQQALASTDRPVYAQGGFGPRATQAFRAMGCSGVILDEKTFSETPEAPRLLWAQEVADPTRRAGDHRNVEIDEAITRMTVKVGKQYRSTGRLVRAIESGRILPLTEYKPGTDPFSPGSALAESHGTRFPIVQGPMTRVSDVPQFAAAVADAGALPMLALGMMSGADARILSRSTAALMGGRPWGVGILAFAPTEIRDAQITETLSARPDYVIISGGRPDQAQQFEQEGIRAYLHVPTLGFLERFLDAGARRFVFEGRECGGHVGRYGSLQLWEQLGDALLDRSSSDDAREFHVLFAGGIHDRCSAAGAAIMAAPLAQRGMCTGVLMGSAYLMTPEAVDSGAVAPGFQKVITDCTDTVLLQSRPGHVYRVANTPMVQDFEQLRSRLTGEGLSGDQLAYELDLFGLGRSRIATKGERRDSSGQWLPVSEELQYQEGMYMVGEVATCCTKVNSMNELHDSIALGSQDITAQDSEVRPGWLGSDIQPPPVDVAIIGVAALVPDATHHDTFWRNILDSHSAIIEVPEDRWDWRLYDNDQGTRQDSVLAQWGGFFPEIPFDPRRYGIPPKVMPHIGVPQLLSLEIARRALADAGYEDGNFDRENTSVIIGTADGGGLQGDSLKTRTHLNLIDPNSKAWDRLPEWTEDSFAGVLTNITAGRVANRFDLGGTNVTLDAACASGLMAVDKAVSELVDGSANMALAGAIDVGQVPFQFLGFSNTRALSPTGELQPFGRGANGTVTGEAITFVVLKRLVDAERDGDRIYSVIKGIGTSSDGKGLGMTAPRPAGQMRALNRAYARAGFTMSTIGLYEAHGTGTPVGDKAEAETLFTLLQNGSGEPANCAVGSVKSLTGHTKNAAGMVGLIKASLALFHRTLPPHAGIDEPIEVFQQSDSPAYLPKTPRPWLSCSHARRAGVSAFGFGGTNAHAVLEEYPAERAGRSVNYGARHWSPELYLLAAVDRPTAANACRELAEVIRLNPDIPPCDLSYSLAVDFDKQLRRSQSETSVMLAFVSASIEELQSDLVKVATSLVETKDEPIQLPANVSMGTGESDQMKVACLFPGQGSQYCGMGQGPALYFEEFRALLELADARYQSELGQRISTLISPAALWSEQEKRSAGEALMRTEVAQPALGVIELAYFQVLQRLGLRCDMVAGHSYGEYVALAAASALRADDLLDLSVSRGQAMANCKSESGDSGTMAAVFASREQLIPVLEQVPGLVLANDNGPGQVVISGAVVDVDQAIELLHQQEIRAVRLPVGGAFHSSLMGAAAQPLAKAIHSVEFSAPTRPVYANSDGAPYAHHPSDIQAQLSQHLLQPVQFAAQIEQMYADGARIFLEVGPGRSLVGLTGQILRDREHTIVALEDGAKGMHGFLAAVGKLAVHGILDNILGLYRDRDPKSINLRDQAEEVDPNFLWYLNGAFSRRANEVQGQYGKEPFLTAATALESRAAVAQPVVSPVEDVPVDQPALGSSEPAILPRPIDGFDKGGIEVYREYHETMRQFLKLQESVMTAFLKGGIITAEGNSLPDSNEIRGEEKTTAPVGKGSTASTFPVDRSPPSVDRIQASLSSGRSVDTALPSSSPPVEHSAVPAAIPAINMRQTLVSLVSEITGYPEDMLKLDQDLEAELGVDSIKRVEVIESALKLLPDADSEVLRRRVDELIRLKTIAQLADELQPSVGDVPVDTALPSSSPPVEHSAVPAAIPAINMRQTLVSLVSEITGYPEDMLKLDQDLEAELGVDSIKRVEVIESALKLLPDADSEVLRRRVDELIRLKTIAQLADELQPSVGDVPVDTALPSSSPPVEHSAVPAAIPAINMRQTLVSLVSEITGYPEDMLKLDQDLEAELGVDSIKRVEVIESALKLLPDADSEVLRRRVDELIRLKTIAQLADELQPSVGDVPVDTALPSSSPPVEHSAVPAAIPADQPSSASEPVDFCPRYLIKGSSEELAITSFDPGSKATRFVGLYLITEDPQGLGLTLAKALGRLGAKVGVLTRDVLLDQSQITQQIEALRAEHGPVRGVVHLAGLNVSELPEQLSEWREETTVQLKSLAFILSACVVDLRRPGHHRARVISASALGGDFGRGKNTMLSLPIAGAAVGLLKSLRYECPEISVRSVDFDQIDPDSIINRLVAELSVPAGHTEVGYVGRDRLAYRAAPAPLPSPALVDGLTPKASWVVVVTGGARGITAQVVKEMACPGMTLLLLGTSPLPAKSEDEELVQCDSVEALRAMFLARDSKKGDATTPAEIERRVRDVMRGRQIGTNIEDLENKGARVEYHQIDVRNETAMERFFQLTDVRYGAIDAFVHGAGLIEDAYLERKDMTSFSRVFDTKVDSAYLIERYLDPKKLKLLLLFSSTAGRFGNAGQGDYAAANETLNRFAWRWRDRFPKAKVVSICWGPWAGAGMASARALEKFRTAGIIPISEKAGTNFLTDEIRRGPDSDVEVIAGEGPWDATPAVSLDSLFDLGMLMLTQAHGQPFTGTQP